MGIDLRKIDPSDFSVPIGPRYERRPCGLYESMLKEVAPYTVRGIIWYQGETDGDCHPELYKTIFLSLIRNWRQLWNEELPFLFVQLAPFGQWMDSIGEPYVQIREAQQYAAENVPNTAMAIKERSSISILRKNSLSVLAWHCLQRIKSTGKMSSVKPRHL